MGESEGARDDKKVVKDACAFEFVLVKSGSLFPE